MSGEYDVVRGDSSSSISTSESFENVAAPGASESSESRGSPVVNAENDSTESSEQVKSPDSDTSSPVEDANDQFFTPAHSRHAISLLIKFSAAMFVLPLLTMFTMYHYVFRGWNLFFLIYKNLVLFRNTP
ncbi:hypothetical protein OESDEN_07114 [Oesophagostomum dentatum]|uniref:Uncharacterized protein n=1 Tax=Oesophagostomum dentatum TaxID=61180 RepID=A0A0B1T9Y9_OESDE|nr:hypothetical protein OESDEN_07114 [Oesophagostomum dentatum]